MKVLMFGWEFPPHITGGLGTASYGLTKGLKALGDVEMIFVVPKAYGDEDQTATQIVGAEDIPVEQTETFFDKFLKEKKIDTQTQNQHEYKTRQEQYLNMIKQLTYLEIDSMLRPYMDPEEFEKYLKVQQSDSKKITIDELGRVVYYENGVKKVMELSEWSKNFAKKEPFHFSGKYGQDLYTEVANYAKVAAEIALRYDFDVIHAHDWLTYAAGIAAKRATGKPLVIHVHATEFDRSGENVNQYVYNIERLGMEMADKIITVSNLTRNIVIERYGQNPEKVHTVYNAVEPQEVENKHYQKNVPEKIVTFLGRITFQKGPDYFVEAAYKVLQRTNNVRFVMAGSGDMFHRMIRRVGELRIGDKFHFTNFLKGDDVTKMFALSDVYVMPSVSEPFGISPLEAMRSNVPVIISKQSGVAEILHHAIKIDFWDVDALADSIYGLLKYDGLSAMFKHYGKVEVDNLKWENSAYHVREIYKQVVQ